MASKPRKYCASFPCSKIAVAGSSYCTDHQPAPQRDHKEADPFYLSPAWRRLRNWYIRAHPLCEICLREGRMTPATTVDHVVELKDGGDPLNADNMQSLCHACHNKKTKAEAKKRITNSYSNEQLIYY
ncbi:MAG TPA: HNH endonuclease signature motif containing protein [Desulfobacterales bacterium]|nr:HNH endonuclease signature motif containing protein [Desulfobacterales bacterium]